MLSTSLKSQHGDSTGPGPAGPGPASPGACHESWARARFADPLGGRLDDIGQPPSTSPIQNPKTLVDSLTNEDLMVI